MTNHTTALIERVAEAIRANDLSSVRPDNIDAYYSAARAAIRVVVDECAKVCDGMASNGGLREEQALYEAAAVIRALLPPGDGEWSL